jgi:hypothetical protein
MADSKRRTQITELIERRRRALVERPDISQTMRKLSQSSSRNPKAPIRPRRTTTTTLLLGGAGVLLMLFCVALAVTVLIGNIWLQNQLSDPTTTVQKYYAALKQRNYNEAYSYLAKNLQGRVLPVTFADTYSGNDTLDGVIDRYYITINKRDEATATVTVIVVRRARDTAQLQTLNLVKENGDWRIAEITLGGNVPIPTVTP